MVFTVTVLVAAYAILYLDPLMGFLAIVSSALFLLCFLNMGAGLILFVFSILFSPEIPFSTGLFVNRVVSLRSEDFLSVIFFLGWIARLAVLREFQFIRHTVLNKPILAFMILNLIATVRGMASGIVNPAEGTMFYLKYAQYFSIYFLVVNYVRNYQQVKRFIITLFFVILAFCVYAYWQLPSVEIWTTHRIAAPFSHTPDSTSVAGILAFALALVLAMILYFPGKEARFGLILLFFAILVPFLFTFSRTSYIAFAFMTLVILFFSKNKVLGFLVILAIFLTPIVMPQAVIDRVAYTWRDARELGVDTSTQERIMIYHKLYGMLKESPVNFLFGAGVSAGDILDSQYVRTIVESGLMGLILFLSIMFFIYRTARNIYRNTRIAWMKGFSLGYMAGLLGLLVHGLGAITFTMIRTMEMFWFLTGLMFVYAAIMDEVEPKIIAENPKLALPVKAK